MTADQLINYMVPSLKPSDSILMAKQWMDELHLKELPVIDKTKFLGFVSTDLIHSEDKQAMSMKVDNFPLMGQTCVVAPWKHYYDIFKVQTKHNMDVAAVLDNSVFSGVVLKSDMIRIFSNTAMVNSEGAIIILQTTYGNYSLSEIARITEMNDAALLGVNMHPPPDDPSRIEIILRINRQDVTQIVASLSKSGYQIVSSFNAEDSSFDEEDRYKLLMKYLSV